MELKDNKLKKLDDNANSVILDDNIRETPLYMLDGITEKEFIYNEVSYILELFDEGYDTIFGADLLDAKELIKKTNNGTRFEGLLTSKELKDKQREIEVARDIINEYKRLKRLEKQLSKM